MGLVIDVGSKVEAIWHGQMLLRYHISCMVEIILAADSEVEEGVC